MKSPILGARALLFVAVSAAAVPACQHYEAGDGNQDRNQARLRIAAPAPATVPPSPAVHPSEPRA